MSGNEKKPDPPESAEGWEALSEPDGGTLAPNPELEEALREAAEAVEGGAPPAPGPQPQEAPPEPPAGGEGLAPVESEAEERVEELSAQLVETRDKWLRLQADFDNFRRRALKEREEAQQYGHQNLVKDLLSAVDNLDRAIDHAQKSEGGDLQGLLQGVEMVRRELLAGLEKHGVKPIDVDGKPFDPALMEAMAQSPNGSVPPNTVIDVFQKGYRLRDRLVRPARVVVAREPDAEDPGDGGGAGA